jgi:hypothetical protein
MSPIKYGYFGIVWEILNERAVAKTRKRLPKIWQFEIKAVTLSPQKKPKP